MTPLLTFLLVLTSLIAFITTRTGDRVIVFFIEIAQYILTGVWSTILVVHHLLLVCEAWWNYRPSIRRQYAAYPYLTKDREIRLLTKQGELRDCWQEWKIHVRALPRLELRKRSASPKALARPENQRPPRLAEYLLYFLPKDQRVPMLGDFEEVYRVLYKDQGKRRAQFWYWCQVMMAYQPLWSTKIVKRLAAWGVIAWASRLLSRIIPWEWLRRYVPLDEWFHRFIS